MIGRILAAAAVAAFVIAASAPASAKSGGYWNVGARSYQWSTNRPFSGWVMFGARSYYCDYIKYPKRRCYSKRVCKGGRCYPQQKCKFVGWDIRQTCR